MLLSKDVYNLKIKLLHGKEVVRGDEVTVLQIMNKIPTICITFGRANREATPEEFKTMKIFASEEGYDFREEQDIHPERKLYYYILSAVNTPF